MILLLASPALRWSWMTGEGHMLVRRRLFARELESVHTLVVDQSRRYAWTYTVGFRFEVGNR